MVYLMRGDNHRAWTDNCNPRVTKALRPLCYVASSSIRCREIWDTSASCGSTSVSAKEKKCLIPVSCKAVVSLQSSGVICFQLTHLRIMLFDILLFVIIVLISFSITLLLFFHSVYKNRKNIYPLFTKYLCFHNGRNKSCNTEGHLTFRNTCTTSHSDLQVKA